ncbi:MAG: EamA family transporter, partial [Clostridia bacterium]|nr:EamA family transporter [Clostridia bacterium]
NTCLALGMQKGVSSTKASFLAIIEPAFALIWDKVLFNVSLSTISMIGILIIFSSFFITLKT